MGIGLSELIMILFSLAIPIGFVILIYTLVNNWVKKSNAIKKENNLLLKEMIELLKKTQGD